MDRDANMEDDRRDTEMSALADVYTMTVPDYLRAEKLLGWERTELIEGIVYTVPHEKNRHRMAVQNVRRLLDHHYPNDDVPTSGSVQLGIDSIVAPDVYVIDGASIQDPEGYVQGPTVLLVVEVSVTTLNKDLGPKLRAYAKAAIPEVWVIDPRPQAGTLLRHTEPSGDRYERVQRFDVGECAKALDIDHVRA
jgi:Uma2 family endonuclease